ncbi:dephospho-CoA kinase [Neisseria animalis]|uniref:Dephospho-CoA kinase n=1 Tax=Neisseria animalis TaxID=492 RepID=A0A5P3MRV6_NEIAN|nr:dephospho-CoA kinase [Neisseria animalis]QEY24190.1 dephospho-CoA kinase [Neisseria animalis]ROW32200.1 dephospho-CoA kinase [Neisseria animalis]VEE06479.1 dephospho-CoA kinase [Neisseria animalis]
MTVWIGLTGGIGSGKSQAAAEFAKLGVPHIDADAVSRSLTADGGAALPEIRRLFGEAVFCENGSLNRTALRDLVFRRPEAKKQLEDIMFPLILSEICRLQTCSRAVYGILDIPLLIEQPLFRALVHRILVIDVSEDTQIRRVQSRSGLKEAEIRRIIANQAPRRQRLLHADDILCNEGSTADLAQKIQRLHHFYRHLKQTAGCRIR